jgi:actin-related protein 5
VGSNELICQDVVEKTDAELAATAEKRKETGRKLQEMQRKQRDEKVSFSQDIPYITKLKYQLALKMSHLEFYNNILLQRALLSPKDFENLILSETEFESEGELESWVKKTEADLKRKQRKDLGEDAEPEEDPTFPLVDRPDEELTEEDIKEKRKQRLMKAGWEARVKMREEKAREKERLALEEKKEEEERMADPDAWAKRLRLEQEVSLSPRHLKE